jgi:hypothetical protein
MAGQRGRGGSSTLQAWFHVSAKGHPFTCQDRLGCAVLCGWLLSGAGRGLVSMLMRHICWPTSSSSLPVASLNANMGCCTSVLLLCEMNTYPQHTSAVAVARSTGGFACSISRRPARQGGSKSSILGKCRSALTRCAFDITVCMLALLSCTPVLHVALFWIRERVESSHMPAQQCCMVLCAPVGLVVLLVRLLLLLRPYAV